MPAKSQRMQRFMAGCEHNPEKMKGKCPPHDVAAEFSHKPPGGYQVNHHMSGPSWEPGSKKPKE